MKQYKIKKVGKNEENPYSIFSNFGDSQEYFQGYSYNPPTVGERFVLITGKLGNVVIDTSPVIEVKEGEIVTTYSVYKIEEIG